MDLNLPPPREGLTSRSQIARVATERWTAQNFYCVSCGSNLLPYRTSTPVYDFYSSGCPEKFQLRSAAHLHTTIIQGAGYDVAWQSIIHDRYPSLILLHYDRDRWKVEDLSLVHRACITTSCIERRNPLTATAQRPGWLGYNIRLNMVPRTGMITVISEGLVNEKATVLARWRRVEDLLKVRPAVRGWLADVLRYVETCYSTFTLENIYAFEKDLQQLHPNNHNVKAKIRQQLQVLRDLGFVEFLGSGEYRRIDSEHGR